MHDNKNIRSRLTPTLAGCLLATVVPLAGATEGGGSSYPMGVENYLSGALPPPGWYAQVYAQHYAADDLIDNDGHALPVDFRLRANVIAPRLVWVTDKTVLGGNLAAQAIVPLVDLEVAVNGNRDENRGVGDVIFGPALGYHYSDRFHAVYALDIFAPTGSYERDALANLGRNYWALEPVAAFTYMDPSGLNADLKLMYDFNAENPDTSYRSGQEFHGDFALGWGTGNGWVWGVGGYFYRQVTDDRLDGERVEGNKGRAFALGPSIKYTSRDGWFLTAKWQRESGVRNRPEGAAYWLKLTVPL